MATQLNTLSWQKTLSLDRNPSYLYRSDNTISHLIKPSIDRPTNISYLHSHKLKQSLIESRKAFLNLSFSDDKQEEVQMEEKSLITNAEEQRKVPSKKISFKCKKTSSVYRRNQGPQKVTISANTVAELTKKFNQIIVENKTILEEPQFKRLVKRVNSQKNSEHEKLVRKVSLKQKPKIKTKPQRPTTLDLSGPPAEEPAKVTPNGTVRATIEIFEKKTSPVLVKPKVPERTFTLPKKTVRKIEPEEIQVPVLQIPALLPQRRCDSMYETLNLKKVIGNSLKSKSVELIPVSPPIKPNTSFLWGSQTNTTDCELIYDTIEPKPVLPPKPPDPPKLPEKIYEDLDDGYEYFDSPEDKEPIYEALPALPARIIKEPLPPRPDLVEEVVSNCYESIYNVGTTDSNYETIYGVQIREGGSNRDSLLSTDQQSNSLYGRWSEMGIYNGKATSELSSSDRSDEWVDVTDTEEGTNKTSGIVIVQKQRARKGGWSQHFRDQWSKSPRKISREKSVDSDSDHHYESLYINHDVDDDYDSFDSDTDSENSQKNNLNDSGVDIANNQLPEPPNNQAYVLTRIAATAGKHMRKLRRNWSLTKNDISKSLSRMTKRKSRTDLEDADLKSSTKSTKRPTIPARPITIDVVPQERPEFMTKPLNYQSLDFPPEPPIAEAEKTKSLTKKGFLNKFRRSMSLSAENASELTSTLSQKPKSTFYLTETINVDGDKAEEPSPDSGVSLSPIPKHNRVLTRPQSPPPPAPPEIPDLKKPNRKDRRASSWYAEAGLFKNNAEAKSKQSTFWYAEVGLYQPTEAKSTPSTSSAENSGNNSGVSNFINQDNTEAYYNMKNGSNYYNESVNSLSSQETKQEINEIQLRLMDEPLYQFYDAAVLESVCYDGTSDFDSDGYEEVGHKRLSSRPSAMELVSPKRNSIVFTKTLWCEIPEVIQSSVLSTLSSHQKRLQEAKFEIITSEASYLNSLNVLNDHFIRNLKRCEQITMEEFEILFGKIASVRQCSEKLLQDLEHCWQDNILLYGVCDIVKKHAEEHFDVYVEYCENQILLDATLKRIKERVGFGETLRQLEGSAACQSLTLYSFLLLPMQRITRLPLLVDAVLKRLSEPDEEYLSCQIALATLNKVVSQCNEGARTKERENELKKIASQLEFSKGVAPIEVVLPNRWLVRSGLVTQMQQRSDETKLTFGKRFSKSPLHIFLFNDILFITKPKSETLFSVIHYCPRNLVELNSAEAIISLPIKDSQGRHLLFMTMLENQDEKTVEFLLSCGSESDKERWTEALTPPKSEDPDETLYECWDCPQVTAIHNYIASQPDELAVARGDVINVLRKMADGWYHGERIRDGQTGWFPANYTVEIANPHVRARNLKQRYRLLAFSENYLKTK